MPRAPRIPPLLLLAPGALLLPAPAAASAEQPYSVAMHVHGAFSEGMASMEWHTDQAQQAGVDVIWWTDHDWRLSRTNHLRKFDFEAAFYDTLLTRITEPDDAYPGELRHWTGFPGTVVDSLAIEGTRCLRIRNSDSFNLSTFLYGNLAQTCSRLHNKHSLAARVRIRFALFPEQFDGIDSKFVLQVTSSEHPAEWPILRYVIGTMEGEGANATPLPWIPGQWNEYDVDVTGDAIRLFSQGGADSVRAEDGNLFDVRFQLGVRNGQETVVFLDDYHVDTDSLSGMDLLAKAGETAAFYGSDYPAVTHFLGSEVSWYRSQPHLNAFTPSPQLVDYTGTTSADSLFYAVNQIHAQGGAVSLNHAFGVGSGVYGDPETPEEKAARIEYTKRGLIASRAHGADVFEAGYRIRDGIGLTDYVGAWDALTGNAVFLTGNGVTDSHGSAFLNGWGPWQPGNPHLENNFVTWLWAEGLSETAFVDALLAGRAYFGDPWAWDVDGTIDLSTPDGFVMGRVVLTDRPSHDLVVHVTNVPPAPEIRLIQGEVRENPAQEYLDVNILRDEILPGSVAAGAFTDTVTIDTTLPSFVRVEVGVPGQVWAFSNPVTFVRSVPQSGVAAPRVAAALGDVRVLDAQGFRLTGASWIPSPPELVLSGDEETPGLGTVEVECGPLGAPSAVTGTTGWSFDAGLLTLVGFTGSGSQAHVHWGAVSAEPSVAAPGELALRPVLPNPFGEGLLARFTVPGAGRVTIEVFEVTGRRVRTLLDEARPAGLHEARWDGRDEAGRTAADGVYLLRLTANGETRVRKAVKLD